MGIRERLAQMMAEREVNVRLPLHYRRSVTELAEAWPRVGNDGGGLKAKERVIYEVIVRRHIERMEALERANGGPLRGWQIRKDNWRPVSKDVGKRYDELAEENNSSIFFAELIVTAHEVLEKMRTHGIEETIEKLEMGV